MATYGFLGLGIMGSRMAANLVRAGFEVTVWNRSADKCAPLVELGARQGATPREVVAACDITFAMLADPAADEAVLYGPDGVLAGVSAGHDFVDMSTLDDGTTRRAAAAVRERRARYLEAPVTGSKQPAEEGQLVVLAAGDRALFDAAVPAFDVVGKKSVFLGEVGNGSRMKLVVNAVMGSMMAALAEGVALGTKAGLDGTTILEVLDAGATAAPMFKVKGPLLVRREFEPAFPLKHQQKDLRLALALAESLRQPTPGIATTNETFKRAMAEGHGDEDMSAVFEVLG